MAAEELTIAPVDDPFDWSKTGFVYAYRCSLCGELIAVENVSVHQAVEATKDTYPGMMRYSVEYWPGERW